MLGAIMLTEYDWVLTGLILSSAVTVKLIVPAVVGVPVIVAVPPLPENDKPPGHPAPGVRVHVQQVGRISFALSV
jgi:hypothetical protein